jgi:hypothetical protein
MVKNDQNMASKKITNPPSRKLVQFAKCIRNLICPRNVICNSKKQYFSGSQVQNFLRLAKNLGVKGFLVDDDKENDFKENDGWRNDPSKPDTSKLKDKRDESGWGPLKKVFRASRKNSLFTPPDELQYLPIPLIIGLDN